MNNDKNSLANAGIIVWRDVVDHVAAGQVFLTLCDRQRELAHPRVQRAGVDVVLGKRIYYILYIIFILYITYILHYIYIHITNTHLSYIRHSLKITSLFWKT